MPSAHILFLRANLPHVPISKCRGEWDLGLCTTSLLANRMPSRLGKFWPILQPNTFFNRKSPPRIGILTAITEVVQRPRSDCTLHFDLCNIWQIRMEKLNSSARRLLPATMLESWTQTTFELLLTNFFKTNSMKCLVIRLFLCKLFVCFVLFVFWYKTRKSLLCLPSWARSNPPGSISTCVALPAVRVGSTRAFFRSSGWAGSTWCFTPESGSASSARILFHNRVEPAEHQNL